MNIPPDFETSGPVRYTHRTTDDCDIYFVSNRSDQPIKTKCKFRTTGQRPELWNPVTGEMRLLPEFIVQGNQTIIPLNFDVHEGYLVVFRKISSLPQNSDKKNFPENKQIAVLNNPWSVSFDPAWGGPVDITFDQLTDWSQNADPGIKYYSGTAVYKQTFDLTSPKDQPMYLDLGHVKNVARIRLNGRDLGVVWTYPWQVDISRVVKAKGNQLEIEVANLWPNRLIGDEQLPDDGIQKGQWPDWLIKGEKRTSNRYTFATHKHYKKDSPLLESGLLGPVTIKIKDK